MASTRDINSKGNYCLEQNQFDRNRNYIAFDNGPSGRAYDPAFPELYGLGNMPADNLSHNSTDIESTLFGIGSSNLVKEIPKIKPDLKTLPVISFFDRPKVVLHKKCDNLTGQRPFIV